VLEAPGAGDKDRDQGQRAHGLDGLCAIWQARPDVRRIANKLSAADLAPYFSALDDAPLVAELAIKYSCDNIARTSRGRGWGCAGRPRRVVAAGHQRLVCGLEKIQNDLQLVPTPSDRPLLGAVGWLGEAPAPRKSTVGLAPNAWTTKIDSSDGFVSLTLA
jgi:hypothetical protein